MIFNGVRIRSNRTSSTTTTWAAKTYNRCPTGWTNASDTPFKRWKRNVHNGGVADPCIVSSPKGITTRGEIRQQYTHAIDVTPPCSKCSASNRRPCCAACRRRNRRRQFQSDLRRAADAGNPHPAILRMLRLHAIYCDGWKAVTFHPIPASRPTATVIPTRRSRRTSGSCTHVAEDFSECRDLATQEPERLQNDDGAVVR